MNKKRRIRRPHPNRLGAAVVEFALVSPLLIMLTMGMMEIGRLVMVKQLLINASREGARFAVLPASTAAEVESQVTDALLPSITEATVTISPVNLEAAAAGTPISVSVTVPAASVSWIPHPLFSLNSTIEASTTMRREGQ